MIKEKITFQLLKAPFIISKYVKQDENCNYEKYLCELINQSIYFRELSLFEEYVSPKNEAHGECDCISDNYSLDFKLVLSSSRCKALNELSEQYYIDKSIGLKMTTAPKKSGESMQASQLHVLIRKIPLEEYKSIIESEPKFGDWEYDFKNFLSHAFVKKNILFYLPYSFGLSSSIKQHRPDYNFKFVIENINMMLSEDFKTFLKFRKGNSLDYDSYVAYIYDNNFIISKYDTKSEKLKIVDVIYLMKSITFLELYNNYVI